MHKPFTRFSLPSLRKPAAMLVAYLTLVTPLAPAFAQGAKVKRAQQPAPVSPVTQSTSKGGSTTGTDKRVTLPGAAIAVATPVIVATKKASPSTPTQVTPGGTINYSVTITNTGAADATGVTFSDTVDANTTVDASSAVMAVGDDYTTIGNVNISVPAPGLLANDLDIDAGSNAGMTTTAATKSSASCVGCNNVVIGTDGSFTYDPPVGFTGTDSFTYTANTSGGKSATVTSRVVVSGRIWFVNNNAGACSSSCDGRLSHPFTDLTGFQAVNADGAVGHPQNGDAAFLYESAAAYNGPVTLRTGQLLIGQDATANLLTITGLTAPSGPSQPAFPAMNTASPSVTIVSASNAVNLGIDNTVRGLTVGATTGTKISGTSFGTLTVGNNTLPDVTLNGAGKALDLTTGAFAATSAFSSVTTTSSATQGISLAGITGTVAFGSTTVSGSTSQGILVGTTTANINFGNTSVTGGTDAISLQNNSSGTRTFGTITVTTPSGIGFLHGAGGGAASAGATTITNPTGTGIDIQNSTTLVSFGATTVNKGSTAGTGVNLATDSNGITFGSLAITTSNGAGLTASSAATVTVSSASGSSISATGVGTTVAPAISATSTTFSAAFTSLASTNSGGTGTGITLTGSGGTLTSTTTNIQNPGGIGISVGTSVTSSTFNFGNTTVNGSGGTGVNLTSNIGALTFADLDITPDAGQIALNATNNTGTITTTSGDIGSTNTTVLNITGASTAARTPLAMVLNNVDSTNSTTTGVNLNFVSGNLTVNDPGVATNISNPAGIGIQVQNTASGGTMNFGNTTVSASGGTGIVLGTASNGNAGNVTFAALNISPDSGQRALLATQDTGLITATSGTIITINNTAVEIVGVSAASRTPLNMALTKVSATASAGNPPNGIVLTSVNGPSTNVGFVINGDGSNTTKGGNATGGTIANTSGADGASSGIGIRLENADKVTLRRMQLNDHSNFAVRAFTSSNFTMEYSTINGTNGTNASFDDGSVFFTDTTGTVTFTSCVLAGGWEDTVRALNSTAVTLTNFVIDNCDVSQTATTEGNDAIGFDGGISGAVMTLTLKNSNITAAKGDLLDVLNTFGATTTASIKNNHFSNNHSSIVAAGGGVAITPNGTLKLDVDTNTFRDAVGNALFLNASGDAGVQEADVEGYIRNNTVGVAAIANSGSSSAAGIEIESNGGGDLDALVVSNNQVFQYNNHGIRLSFVDDQGKTANINVTVDGNTVNTPGTLLTDFNGFHLNNGATSGPPAPGDDFTTCLDLKNNNFTGGGKGTTSPNDNDVRLRQRIITTVRLPGYTGANNNDAAVITYLRTAGGGGIKNNSFGTGAASNTVSTGGGGWTNTPGGAPCAQPSFASLAPVAGASFINGADGVGVQPSAAREEAPTGDIISRPFVSPSAPAQAKPAKGDAQAAASASLSAPAVETQKPPVTKSADGSSKSSTPVVVMSSTNVSANIGTLKAGDSVTINFSVTVKTPFPNGTSTVSNQGTVTYNNPLAAGTLNVLTDDPDNPGGPGSPHATVTQILTPPNISAIDAKVGEPSTGQTDMVFVVRLNHAYSPGTSVDYSTANGTATGGASCGGGADYQTTNGTISFSGSETAKTVSVPVCASGIASDKTFTLNLATNVNTVGTITGPTATGTILANPAGTFLVSELRTSGPGAGAAGLGNDFVELYNNTDSPLTVQASDASAGYGIFKMGADCNAAPVLIATIPNSTVIPARGHYLLVGSTYSLAAYATGDQTLTSDIESDANVAVFSTADVNAVSSANRFDAVGFGTNTGGNTCDLLREGSTLPALSGSTLEYSYFRNLSTGTPADTGNNSADFLFADTAATSVAGVQRLGAPGPENKTSPINRGSTIKAVLFDPAVSSSADPNRHRDSTPVTNGTNGTLLLRRTFNNNTGAAVTRLRFRVVDMTAGPTAVPGTADLRLLATTAGSTATSTGLKSWVAMTLDGAPAQPLGGGFNSTVVAIPGNSLPAGGSINVQFTLGVNQAGSFKFFVIVEGLP